MLEPLGFSILGFLCASASLWWIFREGGKNYSDLEPKACPSVLPF